MGIHSRFDSDFRTVPLAGMADDMLAKIVAEHAAQRHLPANLANRVLAGEQVPYTVTVNGLMVHQGRGDLFPQTRVALAIKSRRPVIVMDWLWAGLRGSSLKRAVENFVRAERALDAVTDAAAFARMLMAGRADRLELLRFLLTRYAEHRYPALFARLDQARALYRVYRLVKLGGRLLGSDKSDADPGVLAWIAQQLRDRSPIVSGDYRDAHDLYADGAFLMNAADVADDNALPGAREFSFTNTLPYARKIEFGKTAAGRDFVIQVPGHIYERVAEDAAARFAGVADISYELRAVIGGAQTPQRRARPRHNRPDVRYPTIIVRF